MAALVGGGALAGLVGGSQLAAGWGELAAGFSLGFVFAAVIGLLAYVSIISDGSMTWRVGALGETWTADELRRLGGSWTVLNSLMIPTVNGSFREVDHVAVGPGGVFVVDSKLWPTKDHDLSTRGSPAINEAANKAKRQAEVLRRYLRDIVPEEAVIPSVMFWGSGLVSPVAQVHRTQSGVQLVHGRDAEQWIHSASETKCLSDEQVAAIVAALSPHLIASARTERTSGNRT